MGGWTPEQAANSDSVRDLIPTVANLLYCKEFWTERNEGGEMWK